MIIESQLQEIVDRIEKEFIESPNGKNILEFVNSEYNLDDVENIQKFVLRYFNYQPKTTNFFGNVGVKVEMSKITANNMKYLSKYKESIRSSQDA